MPDTERRSALSSRARKVRGEADDLIARCKDLNAKLLVKQMVLHHIDDVETFFLGHQVAVPSYESRWLDHTETVLSWGEQNLASLREQFAARGGPEHVQVI